MEIAHSKTSQGYGIIPVGTSLNRKTNPVNNIQYVPRLQKGLITIGVICDKGTEVKFKFQECLAARLAVVRVRVCVRMRYMEKLKASAFNTNKKSEKYILSMKLQTTM